MLSFDVSVVVLGMHRSGTSALARLIGLHGFNMPATLLEKSESNQSGFWESSKINSFNNEILSQYGQNWFALDPIDPSVMDSAVRDQFLIRGGNLLREEYGDARRIILKDPRCCRTGWFWLDVLKDMSRRVVVPVTVRNPVEVAQSLLTRNGFDPEFGQLVWLRNYLDAEYNSRHVRRDFLSYDMLLDDWRGAVRRLSANLKLPFEIGPEAAAELDAFVNPSLRHHRVDHKAVLEAISGNPWVRTVYEILHAAAEGKGIDRADMARLDAIRRTLDAATPSFSSFVSNARLERKKADSLREQATQFKRELGESRKISGDLSTLGKQTNEQSKVLERLNTEVSAISDKLQKAFSAQLEEARRIEKVAVQEKAAALVRLEIAEEQVRALGDRFGRQLEEAQRVEKAAVQEKAAALVRLEIAEEQVRTLGDRFDRQLEEARRVEKAAVQEKAAALVRLEIAEEQVRALGDRLDRQQLELGEAYALQKQFATDRDLARVEMQRLAELSKLAEQREQQLLAEKDETQSEVQRLSEMARKLTLEREESNSRASEVTEKLRTLKQRLHELADKYSELKKKNEIRKREIQANELALAQARQEMQRMRRTWAWRLQLLVKSALSFVSFGRLRGQLQDKRQIRRHMDAIEQSGLFDAEWYVTRYADVRESGMKPVLHYVKFGWREGRDPSAQFSGSTYLNRNADVAAADMDPLLHFIEHGRSEGRGPVSPELVQAPPKPVAVSPYAGPAHPVYRGASPLKKAPLRWRRWAEIEAEASSEVLALGGTILALGARDASGSWHEQAERLLALFQMMSGYPPRQAQVHESVAPVHAALEAGGDLIDAWFANDFLLRVRWRIPEGDDAVVVRGFQLSPETGECRIIGEALVQHDLDFVDLDLLNPFYPVLIISSDLQGHAAFLTLLPFPSVFRGGLHYAEMVAAHHEAGALDQPLDLFAFSRDLLKQAATLYRGEQALLGRLRVDIREADGREPLLAEHVWQWLDRCLGVELEVGPSDPTRRKANDYLSGCVGGERKGTTLPIRRERGVTLNLAASDMPSLKLLLSCAEGITGREFAADEQAAATFIVADRNNALPKALISPPPAARKIVRDLVILGAAPSLPYYSGEEAFRIPDISGAIRLKDARKLSQSELLAPVSPDSYPLMKAAGKAGAVLVVAGPGCFNSNGFIDTLETLKNQVGVGRLSLLLQGRGQDIPQDVLHACEATFGGSYWVAGQGHVPKSESVLFLDTAIVFHDRRTLSLLTALLVSPAVASASCVLIAGEEGKKGWVAETFFGGYAAYRRFGDEEQLLTFTDTDWLVRDVYAIAAPSSLFWAARRADVDPSMSGLLESSDFSYPSLEGDRFHVCATLLSATLASPEGKSELSVVPERTVMAGTRFSILRG